MSSADVSIRFSVTDADKVKAAFDQISAAGQASQQKLTAANAQLAASYASLDAKLDQLKSANDNASGGFAGLVDKMKETSGGFEETTEHALNTINHLKLLALAAYAMSPALRSVVNTDVVKALGYIPPVATAAARSLLSFAGPALAFFGRIAVPIGGAVLAWEGLNYVIDVGSGLLDKYGNAERAMFGSNVASNLDKLTKFQNFDSDAISPAQMQEATELANRLAEAKQNISDFFSIQINLNEPALKLQSIWVGVVGAIGDAAAKLNSMSMPGEPAWLDKYFQFVEKVGIYPGGRTATPVAAPGSDKGDFDTGSFAYALRRAKQQMSGALPGGFVGQFSYDIDQLANPTKDSTKNDTNAYDREIEKIKQQIDELQLEADGAGKTSRSLNELKVSHEANLAAMRAGIPVTEKMRAQWKDYGDTISAVTIKLNETKALQEENYKAATMSLSPAQAAAAGVAHGIDPSDWQSHLSDPAARQAASNSAFSGLAKMGQMPDASEITGQISTGTLDDLSKTLVDIAMNSKTGKNAFREFALSTIEMMEQMAIKIAVIAPLARGLQGLFGGFTGAPTNLGNPGGTGGSLGGLFALGGIMTSRGPLSLNRYAGGGVANSPQLAMFGEGSRPEAYVPLPDGRAIPVSIQGNRPAMNHVETNLNVHLTVPPGTSEEGANQMAAAASRRLRDAVAQAIDERIVTHLRTGGLLNPA